LRRGLARPAASIATPVPTAQPGNLCDGEANSSAKPGIKCRSGCESAHGYNMA
jgi:hypothetical protein